MKYLSNQISDLFVQISNFRKVVKNTEQTVISNQEIVLKSYVNSNLKFKTICLCYLCNYRYGKCVLSKNKSWTTLKYKRCGIYYLAVKEYR